MRGSDFWNRDQNTFNVCGPSSIVRWKSAILANQKSHVTDSHVGKNNSAEEAEEIQLTPIIVALGKE